MTMRFKANRARINDTESLTIASSHTAEAARNRLLPEGRLAGPMPWVIAIMIFLTVLATAAGLGLGHGVAQMQNQLAGRLTIQLVEPNGDKRNALAVRVRDALANDPRVAEATIVPDADLAAQIRPWLGENMATIDLPIPALIDVTLAADAGGTESIRPVIAAVAPNARIDADASFLAPVERLMRSLMWLAVLLVLLMGIATGAVVVLAARGAHGANKETIEILHLLGSTDAQIARLFQRRMALDTLFGGAIGLIAAIIAIWLLGSRLEGTQSELIALSSLPLWAWFMLPLIPLLGVFLAMTTARLTVMRALEQSL
jgi:cell division transport system permease protein